MFPLSLGAICSRLPTTPVAETSHDYKGACESLENILSVASIAFNGNSAMSSHKECRFSVSASFINSTISPFESLTI